MTEKIYAFASGTLVDIKEVPDEVFSTNMMGPGIAIIPSEGNIVSPISGEVVMVMDETNHAVGIRNDFVEVLIHFGVDTMNLEGILTTHISNGEKVTPGHPIISYCKKGAKSKGIYDITMLVITDTNNRPIELSTAYKPVIAGKCVIGSY